MNHPYIRIAQEQIEIQIEIQRLLEQSDVNDAEVLTRINAAIREHIYNTELERD